MRTLKICLVVVVGILSAYRAEAKVIKCVLNDQRDATLYVAATRNSVEFRFVPRSRFLGDRFDDYFTNDVKMLSPGYHAHSYRVMVPRSVCQLDAGIGLDCQKTEIIDFVGGLSMMDKNYKMVSASIPAVEGAQFKISKFVSDLGKIKYSLEMGLYTFSENVKYFSDDMDCVE